MIHYSIIADAGGSTTDWALIGPNGEIRYLKSEGLNLNSGKFGKWLEALKGFKNKISSKKPCKLTVYAAGLTDDLTRQKVRESIAEIWNDGPGQVEVHDDMMAACRAVHHNGEVIVGILGTGSNACLYDGVSYKQFSPSLGYVLSDDGGGVDLGKRLIREYFYGELPAKVKRILEGPPYHLSKKRLIQKVYREDFPGGWLASFVNIYSRWNELPVLEKLMLESFDAYFSTRIEKIPGHNHLPVFLLGGIARGFSSLLFDQAKRRGIHVHIPDKEAIRLLAEKEVKGHKKRPHDVS